MVRPTDQEPPALGSGRSRSPRALAPGGRRCHSIVYAVRCPGRSPLLVPRLSGYRPRQRVWFPNRRDADRVGMHERRGERERSWTLRPPRAPPARLAGTEVRVHRSRFRDGLRRRGASARAGASASGRTRPRGGPPTGGPGRLGRPRAPLLHRPARPSRLILRSTSGCCISIVTGTATGDSPPG
jgi:hypothetical protein